MKKGTKLAAAGVLAAALAVGQIVPINLTKIHSQKVGQNTFYLSKLFSDCSPMPCQTCPSNCPCLCGVRG